MSQSWDTLQEEIIGLGERSVRKSHYAELRRRNSELEHFRSLIDSASDLILVVDCRSGRILDANEGACRALRYSRPELLTLGLGDLDPAEGRSPHGCTLLIGTDSDSDSDSDSNGSGLFEPRRVRFFDRTGRPIPVELTVRTTMADGVDKAVLVARDIRHRVEVEQALRQAHDNLERRVVERTRALEDEVRERRAAEAAMRRSEQRMRDFAESASDWFWETDADHCFTFVSGRFYAATGLAPTDIIGKRRSELPIMDDPATGVDPWSALEAALAAQRPFRNVEYGLRAANGVRRYVRVSGKPVFSECGRFLGYRGVGTDVTETRLAQQALKVAHDTLELRIATRTHELEMEIAERRRAEASLRKLSAAVEQNPTAVTITDTRGVIEYVNPRFERMSGYRADEVVGRTPALLKSGQSPPEVYAELWATILAGREWRGEMLNRRKDGALYWVNVLISPIRDPDGTVAHYVALNEDITVRKEYEKRLLHQANFDSLTGLPNRILALDRLTQSLASAHRNGRRVVLMFIDLDQFKRVNDTLGHQAGDRLLIEGAKRLSGVLRDADTVARLGGDEFLVLIPDVAPAFHPEVVAERILAAFEPPFHLDGHEAHVSASIGLTIYPTDGTAPQVLMRNADAAMYKAKEGGRSCYRFFTPEMDRQAVERMTLENRLRHALERDELFLVYQPLVDAASGRLIGAEALMRWHSPELGEVPPDRFIPMAEDCGLIRSLGVWALRTACAEAQAWQMLPGEPVPMVTVNLSPQQFRDSDLVQITRQCLADTGLAPQRLMLEITERLFMADVTQTATLMHKLIDLGVSFGIDDFGTGYSSLSYLKRFPLRTLKIDRSFIADISIDPGDATLVHTIIAMAHTLGLSVVAEGVETWLQADFVRSRDCDLIQGFYISKPLTAEVFRTFRSTWRGNAALRLPCPGIEACRVAGG